ncbi:hypothetical protein [Paludibacter sp.]|uniref:hypothetical protein n=1 Tax=Paludibacter sp. TaxID=1898105 RepID=UPI0013534CD3|nr:hypothetical protein [Paludibacter sp.]MTK52371.1 hypothetical protein [Paludibacter sp.]
MKKTTCFILTAFVAGCQIIAAQSNKNDTIARRNVVIERDYVPTIKNTDKLDITPIITEPEIKKTEAVYSEKMNLLKPEYEVNKWPAAAIHLDQNTYKKGYALLGFGMYGTVLGDVFYPIVDDGTQSLTFDTHIHGLFGNTQRQWITNFGLNYVTHLENFDLSMGAYFKRNGFNYYGTNGQYFNNYTANYKDSTNSFINFGLKAGIKSKGDAEAIAYKADVQYNNLTPGTGLGEQMVHITGNIDLPIGEHRIGLAIDDYNMFYAKFQGQQLYPSHSIIGVNPYFNLKGDEWSVRLGLKDYFSINGKGKSFNLMPDVSAQVNLIKTVTLYAGITGEYSVNSMQKITDENYYIAPTLRVDDSYAPIDVFGGIKFSPLAGLLINGSVDYKSYNKQYFYANQYEPQYVYDLILANTSYLYNYATILKPTFNVLYDKASVVAAKLNVAYNWKDRFLAHINATYNNWDTKTLTKAWMKPSTEIEIGGEAKITRNVFVNANYYFAGGRYAYLYGAESVKMKNVNDLSLGASYSYSDWLTAFIRLNNVMGTKYQTYYGYDSLGLNWQIGAAVSF